MNTLWKSVAVIKKMRECVMWVMGREGMRRNAFIEGFVKESIPIVGLILILQKARANHRTYRSFCLNLRTFQICMPITGLIARLPASTWGLSGGLCTNHRIYRRCASAEDLRTQTPTWGHYWGWPVTWPGCRKSHVDFMIPQCFQRASWAHNLLEIGPKGQANRCDGRLLRLMFETNSCKYNMLSLGFQQIHTDWNFSLMFSCNHTLLSSCMDVIDVNASNETLKLKKW